MSLEGETLDILDEMESLRRDNAYYKKQLSLAQTKIKTLKKRLGVEHNNQRESLDCIVKLREALENERTSWEQLLALYSCPASQSEMSVTDDDMAHSTDDEVSQTATEVESVTPKKRVRPASGFSSPTPAKKQRLEPLQALVCEVESTVGTSVDTAAVMQTDIPDMAVAPTGLTSDPILPAPEPVAPIQQPRSRSPAPKLPIHTPLRKPFTMPVDRIQQSHLPPQQQTQEIQQEQNQQRPQPPRPGQLPLSSTRPQQPQIQQAQNQPHPQPTQTHPEKQVQSPQQRFRHIPKRSGTLQPLPLRTQDGKPEYQQRPPQQHLQQRLQQPAQQSQQQQLPTFSRNSPNLPHQQLHQSALTRPLPSLQILRRVSEQPTPEEQRVSDELEKEVESASDQVAVRAMKNQLLNKSITGQCAKSPDKEYLCRDCKMPFTRRGDRDNHEDRLRHTKWKSGKIMALNLA